MENVLVVERKIESGIPLEIWTLNRPEKLNAINSALIEALLLEGERLWQDLRQDLTSVRALVVKAAGEKAFAAGADISEMNHFGRSKAQGFSERGQKAFGYFERLPIPTIAAIRGFALGGGLELAMCCDILIATQNAQFGQPEGALGLVPGFGASSRFLDRIGINKGLELLYSCRRIAAPEALRLGLIQEVLAVDQNLEARAIQLAVECGQKSAPLSNRFVKEIAYKLRQKRFEELLSLESKYFGEIFESEDKKEGVEAFLAKRPAQFKGK